MFARRGFIMSVGAVVVLSVPCQVASNYWAARGHPFFYYSLPSMSTMSLVLLVVQNDGDDDYNRRVGISLAALYQQCGNNARKYFLARTAYFALFGWRFPSAVGLAFPACLHLYRGDTGTCQLRRPLSRIDPGPILIVFQDEVPILCARGNYCGPCCGFASELPFRVEMTTYMHRLAGADATPSFVCGFFCVCRFAVYFMPTSSMLSESPYLHADFA